MKHILHVPYAEKEEAKALGAWWSPEMRTWYVPEGCETPLEKFDRWVKKSTSVGASAGYVYTAPKTSTSVGTGRVDSYDGGRTGPRELKEGCACEALPWEDCEHTRS